jgi:hypothetical protein
MSGEVLLDNHRLWVLADGRPIGAYCANDLRSYVFPLFTPSGLIVLQEAPPDHPHHQGIWAGLSVEGVDLWNAGSFATPRNRQELTSPLGEVAARPLPGGAVFDHAVRWVSAEGAELLLEQRTVSFRAFPAATAIAWHSVFFHPRRVTLGQTKESGLGLRAPPHWETRHGGIIRIASGDVGEAACFDRLSPWLNIEGDAVAGGRAGIVLVPLAESVPWFTRDYGCHVYNPARHRELILEPGQRLEWAMRVLAYDGARSVAQIDALVAQTSGAP